MRKLFTLLFIILFLPALFAQDEADDLEKKIQNPIASMISLPFQNNSDFGARLYDPIQDLYFNGTINTLNIQPVVPFSLGEKVDLIVRTIIPIISLPLNIDKTQSGLGDINMNLYLTPAKPGKVIFGAGLALGLPTAMHELVLGSEKFSMGPGIVTLIQPGTWTIGTVVQNTWSVAGNEDRADINLLYSQVFIVKGLNNGWYLNSAPIITANWEADSGNQWALPLGAGVGKLFKIGKLPVNGQVGYYGYAVKPDGGASSQLRFQLVLLFPK